MGHIHPHTRARTYIFKECLVLVRIYIVAAIEVLISCTQKKMNIPHWISCDAHRCVYAVSAASFMEAFALTHTHRASEYMQCTRAFACSVVAERHEGIRFVLRCGEGFYERRRRSRKKVWHFGRTYTVESRRAFCLFDGRVTCAWCVFVYVCEFVFRFANNKTLIARAWLLGEHC